MAQCYCETRYQRDYWKTTYFYEPVDEINKYAIAQLDNTFAYWLQLREQEIREGEYDDSSTEKYPCAKTSSRIVPCECYYYRRRYYTDWGNELDPTDLGNENADPTEVPPDEIGEEGEIYNVHQDCKCTDFNGGLIDEYPAGDPVEPQIEEVKNRRRSFAIPTRFTITAKEVTEQGCKGDVPVYLQYEQTPFNIKRQSNEYEVSLLYKLMKQKTKWTKEYSSAHHCL